MPPQQTGDAHAEAPVPARRRDAGDRRAGGRRPPGRAAARRARLRRRRHPRPARPAPGARAADRGRLWTASRGLVDCLVVHLGDFVDRGFDSRKVLDHLVPAGGRRHGAGAPAGQPRLLVARVRRPDAGDEAGGELDALRRRRHAAQLRHQARPRSSPRPSASPRRAGCCATASRPSTPPSSPASTARSGSATTSSAMPASGPKCRSSGRATTTCSGSASRS